MKVFAVLIASLSVAAAFAPQSVSSRSSTELNALFDNIANMDLFNRDGSKYGARSKKQVSRKAQESLVTSNSCILPSFPLSVARS